MGSAYDEDLMDNAFFKTLKREYGDLFYKVILEGCVICIPRAGSLPSYTISLDDILGHIIIPNDEMPESHFQTLSGKDVKICNRTVILEYDVGCQMNTQILFEETYYTEELMKYKVLCIENPLEPRNEMQGSSVLELKTLRDCIDFLWIESSDKNLAQLLDVAIKEYLSNKDAFLDVSVQTLKDLTQALYGKCLQIAFRDKSLKEKACFNAHTMKSLKIAVETYLHHGIYRQLFKCISSCSSQEDALLNKIVRNSLDLQFRDLDVRAELHDLIPKARTELSKLSGYSTILGKLSCLRKMMSIIAKDPESGGMLAADDLLPVIIFLVIKTNITNWAAHLVYLKNFHFSKNSSQGCDEDEFLVTTLEAAIEHVKSGVFLGPSSRDETLIHEPQVSTSLEEHATNMTLLFENVAKGDLEQVQEILEKDKLGLNFSDLDLCHPLCACDKCQVAVSKTATNSYPTVHTKNDRGLTVLHIAAMYGKPGIIDYLLSQNADPNSVDSKGFSPLHHAAQRGHQNALLLLAQAGADINAPDNNLNTPLHFCSNNGHSACVKALIYYCEHEGIRLWINAQNSNGDTPLHLASTWGYLDIVKELVTNDADPSIINRRKLSSFQVANNPKVTEALSYARPKFKCGFSIKTASFDFVEDGPETRLVAGETPKTTESATKVDKMLRAISCGDVNLACFYLGLDPLHTSKQCHPLCTCADCNKQDSTQFSPEKLKIDSCNSQGFTALHVAAAHGCNDLVQLLIKNGALVDVQTRSKLLTPLMVASLEQRLKVAKLLLEAGCRVNLQDSKGNTALHYASQKSKSLVELILRHEPKLSLRNKSGRTALQEAEAKMALGIINVLKSTAGHQTAEV